MGSVSVFRTLHYPGLTLTDFIIVIRSANPDRCLGLITSLEYYLIDITVLITGNSWFEARAQALLTGHTGNTFRAKGLSITRCALGTTTLHGIQCVMARRLMGRGLLVWGTVRRSGQGKQLCALTKLHPCITRH